MRARSLSGLFVGNVQLNGGSGTYNLSAGALSAGTEQIGFSGTTSTSTTGTFTQSGGTNTVNGTLYLGTNEGIGAYGLSAGKLSAVNESVANAATGTFTQTGGTNTVSNTLSLGTASNTFYGTGTYNIGAGGASTFTQTGGTHTVGALELAYTSGNSTYNLNGGTLSALLELIAPGGTGNFVQTGGTNVISLSLDFVSPVGASGTYTLRTPEAL